MKNLLLLIILLAVHGTVISQVPQAMNYQAIARDGSGNPLQNRNISVLFTIEDGVNPVYQETQTAITNQFGLFAVKIGEGTVVFGSFAGITWSTGNKGLLVQYDPNGGTNYLSMGETQLISVPYALYAETSGGTSTPGATGATGNNGTNGVTGATGATGNNGTNGATGATGAISITGTGIVTVTSGVLNTPGLLSGDVTSTAPGLVTTVVGINNTNLAGLASGKLWNTTATGVPSIAHEIGDLYQGGIIVSVWEVGGVQHGLIASLVDISTSSAWSNVTTTLIGATAQNQTIGSGNATAIMAQTGATSGAAFLCHSYAGGGYTDWYLPAIWELQQCYNSAMIVNTVLGNTNGFQFVGYWSSTESGSGSAWFEYFNYGNSSYDGKTKSYSVRAVRRY